MISLRRLLIERLLVVFISSILAAPASVPALHQDVRTVPTTIQISRGAGLLAQSAPMCGGAPDGCFADELAEWTPMCGGGTDGCFVSERVAYRTSRAQQRPQRGA